MADGFTSTLYVGGAATLNGATLTFDLGSSTSDVLALGVLREHERDEYHLRGRACPGRHPLSHRAEMPMPL